MTRRDDNRIYVGNLPPDIRTIDVEDLFFYCGKISYIDLKNRKGPPFAFVAFEDHDDAKCAVKYRDAYEYDGYTLRVEFPKSSPPGDIGGRGRPRLGIVGVTRNDGEFSSGVIRGGPPSRRSDFRVFVSGLPVTGSWQDLKDHMREAGDVCYADVFKDGTGVVEFLRKEDMKWAVKNLTNSKFRSHENETCDIFVKEDHQGRRGSGSRSRSPLTRGRDSPSYSPIRHSRSRSP